MSVEKGPIDTDYMVSKLNQMLQLTVLSIS